MIAHPFRYASPATLDEATRLMAQHGEDAAAMAGGTWLVPHMSRAERRPELVVDLRRLGLCDVTDENGKLVLGACVSYERLKSDGLVRERAPVLRAMAAGITGGQGITAQGTLGGAACYGNPSSDVPGCLLALDARLRLASAAGTREVAARDFFEAPFRTARRADEILVAVVVDAAEGARAGYHKLKLSGSSWPIVTASCCVGRGADGGLHARLAIGAAGPVPVMAEATLCSPGPASLRSLAEAAAARLTEGWGDELADAEYRLAVAPTVAKRAAMAAWEALDA